MEDRDREKPNENKEKKAEKKGGYTFGELQPDSDSFIFDYMPQDKGLALLVAHLADLGGDTGIKWLVRESGVKGCITVDYLYVSRGEILEKNSVRLACVSKKILHSAQEVDVWVVANDPVEAEKLQKKLITKELGTRVNKESCVQSLITLLESGLGLTPPIICKFGEGMLTKKMVPDPRVKASTCYSGYILGRSPSFQRKR